MAEQQLRGLGVRSWRRSAPSEGNTLGSLTAREREVARLAAEGAKNAEIARSLFLSPKTVERHLSNVFVKLGVRNRAELGSRHGADLTSA
jgi:DNA-binding NarL/FixJ family response regulator